MAKLGDTKKKIMDALSEKSKTMTDLSNELDLAQSTISEHIQDLIKTGAIIEADESTKKWKYYKINPDYIKNEMDFKRKFGYILIGVAAVAIVASLLIYLTLSNQSSRIACVPTTGYLCSNLTRTSSGQLSVQIGGFPSETQILGVGCSYNSSEPSSYNPLNISLQKGQFAPINVTCPSTLPSGTKVLGIWIRSSSNGYASTEHVANITIGTSPTTSVPATSITTTIPTAIQTTISATTTITQSNTTVQSTISTSTIPTSSTSTSTTPTSSTTAITGSYSPCNSEWVTIYQGQNTTCGSFRVSLIGLGTPNSNGQSPAIINATDLSTNQPTGQQPIANGSYFIAFNTPSGHNLFIHVNNTVDGLYAYQKYAFIYLSSTFPAQPIATLNGISVSSTNTDGQVKITMQANADGGNAPYVYHFFAQNATGATTQSPIYNSSPTTATNYTYSIYSNSVTSIQLISGKSYYGDVYVTDEYGLYNQSSKQMFTIPSGCNTIVTVYVGYNDTCSPFTIQLVDLGQPNANGISAAGIDVYYNGILTNVTQVEPGTIQKYTYSGHVLDVYVNQTLAGLYAYDKYAQVLLTTSIALPSCGLTTVYVGQNYTCSPFTIKLADLGQPNATGSSPAALDIYYSGVLTNVSSVYPGKSQLFVYSGNYLTVNVSSTFAGLYAYEKYATISANVANSGTHTVNYTSVTACNKFEKISIGNNVTCYPVSVKFSQPNVTDIYLPDWLTNISTIKPGQIQTFELSLPYVPPYTILAYTLKVSMNSTYNWAQGWGDILLNVTNDRSTGCNTLTDVYFIFPNNTCQAFTAQFTGFGTANSNGILPAHFSIYYNNALTNATSIFPSNIPYQFSVNGQILKLTLNSTFDTWNPPQYNGALIKMNVT